MPVTFTTDLPDAEQQTLGNGVEDEIAVSWGQTANNGVTDMQYRETGAADWLTGPSVLQPSTEGIIPGLEDGEEYEVRIRNSTEHVVGAWTQPTSIVTKFPGIANLSVDGEAVTSVTLGFDDRADNEDGYEVLRDELVDGEWSGYRTVVDEGPNEGTGQMIIVDDTAQPGTTYRYRVRAYTEHASGEDGPVPASTSELDLPATGAGSSGWHAEVDHPSGRTIELDVLGEAVRRPRINGLPRVEVPVPRDERWQDPAFERAPMRVYHNGEEAPIDELVDVEMHEGRTVLIGRGGSELLETVQVEYSNEEAWAAMRDVVRSATPYEANVDDPSSGAGSDTVVQNANDGTAAANNLVSPVADDVPAEWDASGLRTTPASWGVDCLDATGRYGWGFTERDEFSGGRALYIGQSGGFNVDFTPTHDIPSEHVGLMIRDEVADDSTAANVEYSWDGATVADNQLQAMFLGWHDLSGDGNLLSGGYDANIGRDLVAGETYTFEVDKAADTGYWADVVALYDKRYDFSFPDPGSGNDGAPLAGPEPMPNAVPLEFRDADPAFAVTGGAADVAMNDTSGSQLVELSNDQGATWPASAANSSSVDHDFASSGGTLRARVTLSRFGSRDEFPAEGYMAQELSGYELRADLEDSPIIANRRFRGRAVDVLSEIADLAGFVFEFRREGGVDSVEATQPGMRESSGDTPVDSYEVTKETSGSYEAATIYGASQNWTGERFTPGLGEPRPLDHDLLQESSEAVYDPASGDLFVEGEDYSMDYTAGELTPLAAGAMDEGAEYAVDYEYKTRARYESPSADGGLPELTRTIPGLTTDRGCQDAAVQLVQETSEPVWTARVALAERPPTFHLVEGLDIDGLPGGAMVVHDIEQEAGPTRLWLGSGRDAAGVVDDIESQLSATAGRV